MRLSRPSRIFAVLLAIASLLFTQLAIAAYACPELAPSSQVQLAAADMEAMPGCDEADLEQPSLCNAHMQAPDQSLDKPATPTVAPSAAILVAAVPDVLNVASLPAITWAEPAWLLRSSEPPFSILNCCFRF